MPSSPTAFDATVPFDDPNSGFDGPTTTEVVTVTSGGGVGSRTPFGGAPHRWEPAPRHLPNLHADDDILLVSA